MIFAKTGNKFIRSLVFNVYKVYEKLRWLIKIKYQLPQAELRGKSYEFNNSLDLLKELIILKFQYKIRFPYEILLLIVQEIKYKTNNGG